MYEIKKINKKSYNSILKRYLLLLINQASIMKK
jgi:hypothetical protein|nr:MAG TPA: hypothetical protein [Caudoviricetes sp.]